MARLLARLHGAVYLLSRTDGFKAARVAVGVVRCPRAPPPECSHSLPDFDRRRFRPGPRRDKRVSGALSRFSHCRSRTGTPGRQAPAFGSYSSIPHAFSGLRFDRRCIDHRLAAGGVLKWAPSQTVRFSLPCRLCIAHRHPPPVTTTGTGAEGTLRQCNTLIIRASGRFS